VRSHIIILGNEKGGSGKTTLSAHIAIYLVREGLSVATIDLDARQRSLSRYMENRLDYAAARQISLPTPSHHLYPEAELANVSYMSDLVDKLSNEYQIIVIDTPGSVNLASNCAHSLAQTIVTPVNDSFVDLDLLGQIKGDDLEHIMPGIYSQTVWAQKLKRAKLRNGEIDWIVIRNRLANIEARNKQNVEKALALLSKKFGFRISSAFSERVIFRELFTRGLTLLDIMDTNSGTRPTISHVAARQELRGLIEDLNIPSLKVLKEA
jgi:chromosome partitioning protein